MKTTLNAADGTSIAFEQVGSGRPVILIGGAFNDRTTVAALAAGLAPDFTAVAYDRRGRGGSGDGKSRSVQREVEDLAALVDRVGGRASLVGHSSGGVLALEAAMAGVPVDKVVVYEPPYVADGTRPRPDADLADRVKALLALHQRDEAAALFLTEAVGLPSEMVAGMRASDHWPFLAGLAHSLPYDLALFDPGHGIPTERLARIRTPVLAISGSRTAPWLAASTRAVAVCIPDCRYETLDGQDHGILHNPGALIPPLVEFLA